MIYSQEAEVVAILIIELDLEHLRSVLRCLRECREQAQ